MNRACIVNRVTDITVVTMARHTCQHHWAWGTQRDTALEFGLHGRGTGGLVIKQLGLWSLMLEGVCSFSLLLVDVST